MITVRCSALPRALKCPASVLAEGDRVDPYNEAAELGTAAHALLAGMVESGAVDFDAVPETARRHGVDETDLRVLAAQGQRLWREGLEASFPNPVAEESRREHLSDDVLLTGTTDAFDIVDGEVRILDWKTGRLDADHGDQLLGYAALLLLADPGPAVSYRVVVAWVRDGEVETMAYTQAEVEGWIDRTVAILTSWDGRTRNPGSHCTFCPLAHSCEAATALVRRDVGAVLDVEGIDVTDLAPADCIDLYDRAKLVARIAKNVLDAVKARVADEGDVEADGRALTIQAKARRKLDPLKAWPILEAAGLGDEDFAGCVTLKVSAAEKAVARIAGRGNGKAAVVALNEEMAEAGAITTTESKSLVSRRNA